MRRMRSEERQVGDDESVYIRALSIGQIDEKQWICR
jgi:hypothetical protein